MKDKQALFIHTNKRPVRLSMTAYYKDWQMRQRSQMVPVVSLNRQQGLLDLLPLN
jgi:hypothetical protein